MTTFDDFDAWGDAVSGASLRLCCDGVEQRRWSLGMVDLGEVVLQVATEGGGNLCFGGNAHTGTILFVPLTHARSHVVNGEPLDDGSLLAIPEGADFRIRIRRQAHAWCSIALPSDMLASATSLRIVCGEAAVSRLRRLVTGTVESLGARPGGTASGSLGDSRPATGGSSANYRRRRCGAAALDCRGRGRTAPDARSPARAALRYHVLGRSRGRPNRAPAGAVEGDRSTMRVVVLLTILAIAPAGARAQAPKSEPAAVNWRVVSVHDGDTVVCLDDHDAQHKVRLVGIDAPEIGQAFGTKSRDALRARVLKKSVTVHQRGHDQYGRTLASLEIDGDDVAEWMLDAGMAWHFTRYSDDQALAAAERKARTARRGLWADRDPTPPWEWRAGERDRKKPRSAPAGPSPARAASPPAAPRTSARPPPKAVPAASQGPRRAAGVVGPVAE